MEYSFAVGSTHWMGLGLRYRTSEIGKIQGDYIVAAGFGNNYVDNLSEKTDFGLYLDYGFLHSQLSTSTVFAMSSGLDIASETLTLTTTRDDGSKLMELSSALSVVSLRLGSQLKFHIVDPLGISFGLNLLVPIFGTDAKQSIKTNSDPQTIGRVGDQDAIEKDVQTALGHGKSSFGVEIVISSYFSF